jgi:hypothetical protein
LANSFRNDACSAQVRRDAEQNVSRLNARPSRLCGVGSSDKSHIIEQHSIPPDVLNAEEQITCF